MKYVSIVGIFISIFLSCGTIHETAIHDISEIKASALAFASVPLADKNPLLYHLRCVAGPTGRSYYKGFALGENQVISYGKEGQVLDSIDLYTNNNKVQIGEIYSFGNSDSLFVFQYKGDFRMFLFLKDSLIQSWGVNEDDDNFKMVSLLLFHFKHDFVVRKVDDEFVVVMNALENDLQNPYRGVSSGRDQLKLIKLSKNGYMEQVRSFGRFPETKESYNDMLTSFSYSNDSVIVYGNEHEGIFYTYGLKSGNVLSSQKPKTCCFESNAPFIKSSESPSMEGTNDYLTSNTRDVTFKFDPYKQVFYRIYNLKHEQVKGEVFLINDSECILSIMSPDFKVLGEYKISGKQYDIAKILVTAEGLLIQRKEDKKGALRYDLFELKSR